MRPRSMWPTIRVVSHGNIVGVLCDIWKEGDHVKLFEAHIASSLWKMSHGSAEGLRQAGRCCGCCCIRQDFIDSHTSSVIVFPNPRFKR